MKTTVELSKGCPVHQAIADFLAADARATELAPIDPGAQASFEYMLRCNERTRAVHVLMDRLPLVGREYSVEKLAAAQVKEVAR